MAETITLKGVNYVADINGSYEDADSLPDLSGENVNAVALTADFGIDAQTSQVYDDDVDGGYTESDANIGATIGNAENLGLSVMVRPLLDFLPSNYDTAPDQANPKNGDYSAGEFRSYYNPTNVAAFFASYQSMIVDQATLAQQNGAQLFCIGTELDQLTGPAYESYWDNIISAVRGVFSGKLTYSADWDDALSPWQYGGSGLSVGTGDITTQVSFWNKLDYVGIDNYAPISDLADPTVAQLVDGWTQTPTDAVSQAVTGQQSLISYYQGVAAAIGKPLLFTELGYANSSDAASSPATPGYDEDGNPDNATTDPTLQADLYKAFFQAWAQDGNGTLAGTYLWNWEPGGAGVSDFSVQGLPAADDVAAGYSPACYCRGTLIATESGDVPVEDLVIGDRLVTTSGSMRPIKWIGTRSYAGRFANANPGLLPICFKADSLGDAIPRHDLWVSPKHAMFIDDVLIPAEHLVNGRSILQARSVERVDYIHIELETHDVLFAEGAPSETFVDDDSRGIFHNVRTFAALYPEAGATEAIYCAPRVEDGPVLEAVRRRLADRDGIFAARGFRAIGSGTPRA